MTERGLTIRRAAEIADISDSTIDDWRNGATPADYLAVKRLAAHLGVSLSFILTGEDETQAKPYATSITEVFEDGGSLFDGYAKITIQRLIPRTKKVGA